MFVHFKSGIWVPPQHLGIGSLTSSGGCDISIGWAEPECEVPSNAAASQQKKHPGMSIFSVHSFPSGVDVTHFTVPSLYGNTRSGRLLEK
jgi:hypothetical protein